MKPTTRSMSGAVLMLAIIPAIIGILACLPVPIGDPERSRIDPEITGIWAIVADDETVFWAFEPFDKRTWLLTGVPLEEGDNADFIDYDLETFEGLAGLMATEAVGEDGATATEMAMYKVWMTKLGGVWFMTWEPKGLFGSEQFATETWFTWRVEKPDPETLELHMIGGKKFFPDDLEKTRRAYERVIKKNAKNPEMYTEDPWILRKVVGEHREFFAELADEVIKSGD